MKRLSDTIDTILFDFDGTVMDTNGVIVASWQHTFRHYAGQDGDLDLIYRSFGEPIHDTARRFFPDQDPEAVVAYYRAYHVDCFESGISLFPGILPLLKTLKEKRYLLGLVTSRLRRTTTIGMNKFGLFDYFDALVTVEETERPKPDPAPILLALERLNRKPECAAMIGDTLHDIRCAKSAGVCAGLVAWSVAVEKRALTEENSPDFILEHPEDLLEILPA
jgi:pyrophosphatase PpaX